MFIGIFELGDTVYGTVVTKNTSGSPTNADSLPTYRVYGDAGLLVNGTASFKDTGTVTGATNASPIVVTSSAHGLSTGTRVTITGVSGNTAANGTFDITNASSSTYSLDGSTGNGSFSGNGTWNVSGLYKFSFDASGANGFASGGTYSIVLHYTVSGTAMSQVLTFSVA